MRMTLDRRVRALEAGAVDQTHPITLFFADGSKVTWPDGDRRWRRLWRGFYAPQELGPPQEAADLELVCSCVGSQEPGGAQMLVLLNAVLNSTPAADDETIPRRRGAEKSNPGSLPQDEHRSLCQSVPNTK
jgi:hypothetical protein